MELCLRDNDPSQTLLLNADGVPLYKIESPGRGLLIQPNTSTTTTVWRMELFGSVPRSRGHTQSEIGRIKPSTAGSRTLLGASESAEGSELLLNCDGELSTDSSWSFTGPDGQAYRWLILIKYPVLITGDSSSTLIARYHRAKLGIVSRSRRPFLEILPAGTNIIDLIVVTFVTFSQQYLALEQPSREDQGACSPYSSPE